LKDLIKGVDKQLLAVPKTWFKTRYTDTIIDRLVLMVSELFVQPGRRLVLEGESEVQIVARSTPLFEVNYLFIEVILPYPILVCAIYNSPNIKSITIFGSELEPLIFKYSDVLILGDLSHDVLKSNGRVTRFLVDLGNLNLHE
jgi:hypothetical protein